jgi:D-3-phosphoglycerate dehydrogenase
MDRGKVLITEPVHSILPEGLKKLGYEVQYHPDVAPSEVLEKIEKYTGLIINSRIVADRELLMKAVRLKFVARCGSGKEVIDFDFCSLRGVAAITSPEGNRQAVAEHAVGMLLCLMNNLHRAHEQVKQKKWLREENRGIELFGKVVGIIGFGNTGESFAQALKGFSPVILAYDKYRKNLGKELVNESELDEIFEKADVVSLHLPLTPETIHYADNRFFSQFKKPIWFINTSRGACVNSADLLSAISGGQVLGAALDVLENEKFESYSAEENVLFDALVNTGKVLFTPHIAGWTHESKRKIAEVLLSKIASLNF